MTAIKVLASAALLLTLAACESPTAQPTTGSANPGDVNFVTNAYQIIRFDQQEGAQANTEARDPRVKALAQRLVDEANQFEATLGPVAKSVGVTPPNVLRDDLRVRLGHMRLQHGLDFDRTYLDDQIASHEEALRNQETMVNGKETSPAIKDLAQRGEILLRTNLQALRAIRQDMGGSTSSS
jgi:predicted outer membrane protein